MTHKMLYLIPKQKLSWVMHSQMILLSTEHLNIIIYIKKYIYILKYIKIEII